MESFLSCDWGTSSFRLRLVRTDGLKVLAEESNSNGIAITFKNWRNENTSEDVRLTFYQSYLLLQIKKLENSVQYSLDQVPVLLSGMASSSIGMIELPYKELPFKKDGSDINSEVIDASGDFPHILFIISGACTGNDVLRGEETLLVGADAEENGEGVYIFPGTHSKHIRVQNGVITHFQTYMTGEFFELLSTKSILSNSVENAREDRNEQMASFFEKGVLKGSTSNLLNTAFHVRTNALFKKMDPAENYHFLSGLVIGSELKDLAFDPPGAIVLVSSGHLQKHYWKALQLLELNKSLVFKNADEALLKGQWQLYKRFSPSYVAGLKP